jgi:hypothetical protein
MKAIYPMVGGTATSHKFNLITPADTNAAFRLQFFGGWTHSTNGALPNGVDAYADTFLSKTNLTEFSTHISYYSRSNITNIPAIEMGIFGSGSNTFNLLINFSGVFYLDMYDFNTNRLSVGSTDSRGFWLGNRSSSTSLKAFKNGTQFLSTSNVSNGWANLNGNMFIGNRNDLPFNTYSNKECAFSTIGDGLTDLESQLFYQITEKYQAALGRNINPTQSFYYNSAYNNETNAFLFSTQITDATIQTATNTLVSDLKTANIWTKMKAVYPMVGGTATTHKFNLVNAQDTDAAFRLTFAGGITHSSTGITGNGTNGYANTQFNPSVSSTLNNTHISFYSRTNNDTTAIDVGNSNGSGGQWLMALRFTGVGTISDQYNSTTGRITTAQSDSRGLFIGTRTTSAIHKAFKNGIQIGSTNTGASGSFQNLNITLLAQNQNNIPLSYSTRECAFASIGDGLTDAEALALYNATQTFQTTLGRQV